MQKIEKNNKKKIIITKKVEPRLKRDMDELPPDEMSARIFAKRISIVSRLTLNIADAPPLKCESCPSGATCICFDNTEKLLNAADLLRFAVSFFPISIRRDAMTRRLERNQRSEIVVRYISWAWKTMLAETFDRADAYAELDQALHEFGEHYTIPNTRPHLDAMRAQVKRLLEIAPYFTDEVIYWRFMR